MSNRAANASNWNDSKPLAVLGRSCLMIAALGVLGDWTAPRSLAEDGTARPVTQIAAAARSSVVVVTHEGRGGEREGLGTGFVVSSDGLIATNYHVIGEARPIFVETADGRRHEVTEVHASDKTLDLAVLRVKTRGLTPLELGDSDELVDGQAVVAIGNPHGLTRSVVGGVVSGRRTIDQLPLIQLAIPIEPGNSGGPLLDDEGRVRGILTMKSAVTANLGFAIEINALKPLLEKPNPIVMERWLTIGALDPRDWTPLFGARWRQRAGRIVVEGSGDGFGGRSLCLSTAEPIERPFEVAVSVKLADESQAAGLIFEADGENTHYGFYPTAGKLRLTRFEGADVFSWTILDERASAAYRAGDWNAIKVRVETDRLLCYVNDTLVIESADDALVGGRVGLAKFRDTRAEFKGFRMGDSIAPAEIGADQRRLVDELDAGKLDHDGIRHFAEEFADEPAAAARALVERAARLEVEAEAMRRLAQATLERESLRAILGELAKGEDEVDLVRAALWVARLDNDEVDVDAYLADVARMVADVREALGDDASEKATLTALNKYLFEENGFHGGREDYYNRANSYMNEVIDDREGLPITLSILYLSMGRQLGLEMVGVGLPGHFVVEHRPTQGEPYLIDVFERGQRVSEAEARRLVLESTGQPLTPEERKPARPRQIVLRLLGNLLGEAVGQEDDARSLRYLDAMLAVDPTAAREHGMRAVLRYRSSDFSGARVDADWLDEHRPAFLDLAWLARFREMLDEAAP